MNYTIMALLGAKDIGLRAGMMRASGDVKRGVGQIESSGSRASKAMTGLKAGMAAIAVVAASFLIAGVSQAIKFEAAMRNVNSISRLSEASLAGLSDQVLALSTRVPQSAQVLAEGLYDVASSGFQGAEGMEVLEQSAVAASAGLSTTDVAARAIVASLNAYGLSASDAADVSDILFQTVNVGVVSFEELASELGDVVGGAAAAGVALDEVGAATAAMTLSGLSAAESTTSLNRLIQALIDPSDALSNAFTNLGYDSGKAALDALGLHGTMELLRESTGGNIETLLQLFPEIRAARGAFALMAADGQNYAETFAAITDEQTRAGATQAAFNEQMKALGNQWDVFVNQISAAAIQVGTVLIPALRSGLQWVQQFGQGLGGEMRSLATAAQPAIEALGDALSDLGRFLQAAAKEASPVARALATMVGAAVIGGVTALATALGELAGFLADHPALIRAVGLALGGILLGNLVSSAAAAAKFAVQFRAMLIMETLGPLAANLATRVLYLGSALKALATGQAVAGISNLSTAFSGLLGLMTSPAVMAGGFLAGLYAVQTGMNNARQNARELRAELEQDIDMASLTGMRRGLEDIGAELEQQRASLDSYGSDWRTRLIGAGQLLTPFENSVADTGEAVGELGDSMMDLAQASDVLWSATNQLKGQFDLTQAQAEEFLRSIEFDPSQFADDVSGEWLMDVIRQFEEVQGAALGATPATNALADSFETVSDVTATAADQISAFQDAIDGLLGISISAREAEAQLAGAIHDLGASVLENGLNFDVWTEAGRANEEALRGNISAMTDLASATAEETGSVQAGVEQLTIYRQQLIDNLTAMGMSRSAAEDLVAAYGLTPENLETLVQLQGADTAADALTDIQGMMAAIAEARAEGTVSLDTTQFDGSAAAIGQWLVQIGMAAPEAEVLLNGDPFYATAGQVEEWAAMWDDSSPEAQALLNIIDPENDYETLSEAAANWGNTSTSGSAGLNDQASSGYNRLDGRADQWGSTRSNATAGVNDHASARLSEITRQANILDGYVATMTVNVNVAGLAGLSEALRKRELLAGYRMGGGWEARMGGMWQAQTGLMWEAGITHSPQILFGERATGGEAFIPRLGSHGRSMKILAKAASWYGAEIVPRSEIRPVMGMSGGRSVTFAPVTSVQVRADAGVDTGRLTRMIRRELDDHSDRQFDQLRKELAAR